MIALRKKPFGIRSTGGITNLFCCTLDGFIMFNSNFQIAFLHFLKDITKGANNIYHLIQKWQKLKHFLIWCYLGKI